MEWMNLSTFWSALTFELKNWHITSLCFFYIQVWIFKIISSPKTHQSSSDSSNMNITSNLTDKIFEINVCLGLKQRVTALSIKEVIDPEPLTTGPISNSCFTALICISLILGFFYRTLLFYNVLKTGGLFGRPINLLTGNFETNFFAQEIVLYYGTVQHSAFQSPQTLLYFEVCSEYFCFSYSSFGLS